MADLIYRQVVLKELRKRILCFNNTYTDNGYHIIKKCIEDLPSADTERHAHWEKGYYTEQGRTTEFFYCSNCLGTHNFESNYCEDCGCRMNEVKEQ